LGLEGAIQLLRFSEPVAKGFNHNVSTSAVLLDIEKTFDRVWHADLITKMISLRIPYHLLSLIESFLHRKKFFTIIVKACSSFKELREDVSTRFLTFTHSLFDLHGRHTKTDQYLNTFTPIR
jgi:hypothetical protein